MRFPTLLVASFSLFLSIYALSGGNATHMHRLHKRAPWYISNGPVGLTNSGRSSNLISVLQYMHTIKPLRDAILAFPPASGTSPVSPGTAVRFVQLLCNLFGEMERSEISTVLVPTELINAASKKAMSDIDLRDKASDENDPFTLLKNMYLLIHEALLHTRGAIPPSLIDFYDGSFSRDILNVTCTGGQSLHDSLSPFFNEHVKSPGSPDYDEITLRYWKGPPKLMEIRLTFIDTPMQVPTFTLPSEIAMDRYLMPASNMTSVKRARMFNLQETILSLETRESGNAKMEESKVNTPPTSRTRLGSSNREMIGKLRADIDTIWENDKGIVYELVAVIMRSGLNQRGTVFTINQRVDHKTNRWLKYNPSVSDITDQMAMGRTLDGRPYAAVYVLASHRNIIQSTLPSLMMSYMPGDFHLEKGEHIQYDHFRAGLPPTYVYLDPLSLKLVCHTSARGPSIINVGQLCFVHPAKLDPKFSVRGSSRMAAVFQKDKNFVQEFYDPHLVMYASETENQGDRLTFDGQRLEIRGRGSHFVLPTPIT